MAHKKNAGKRRSASKGTDKTFASRRTMNQPAAGSHQANTGSANAQQQHDPANRMGSFEGKGEHARTGNRGHQ